MNAYFLYGPRKKRLGRGRALRLLSAWELLEARREGEKLARSGEEIALCANACLLAHAMVRWGRRVYPDGAAVLAALTAGEIAATAEIWAEFDRAVNPSPGDGEEVVDALKKVWSTRRMSVFAGACFAHLGRCLPSRGREQ